MEYGGTFFMYRFYFRITICDSFTFLMWNVYFRWNLHLLNFANRKTTKICVFSIFYTICYYVRQLKQTTMFKWSGYEPSQSHFYMFIVFIWNTRRYTHSIERSAVFSTWFVDFIIKANTHIRTSMFKKNVLCIFLFTMLIPSFIRLFQLAWRLKHHLKSLCPLFTHTIVMIFERNMLYKRLLRHMQYFIGNHIRRAHFVAPF